jgi:hypothetical protein
MQKQPQRSVWCTIVMVKNTKKKKETLKEKLHGQGIEISKEAPKERWL